MFDVDQLIRIESTLPSSTETKYHCHGHTHGGSTDTGPFSSGGFDNDGGVHSRLIQNGPTGIAILVGGGHTHTVNDSAGFEGLDTTLSNGPLHYQELTIKTFDFTQTSLHSL